MKCLLLMSCLFFGCTSLDVKVNPTIHLTPGSIFGLRSTNLQGKPYYRFEKVPYATPPVGKLRFQAPQPPHTWNGTLNCTHLDVKCHQLTSIPSKLRESEDCLYLNIFTPQLPDTHRNISLPVMFYIYGGGFNDGYSLVYGPDFFINADIILVTINYRLGPFGFLSTQDAVIPGNNGLKDQHLALKWVQKHIALFGGNPRKVTIFGHSAGSASVGYHLLNLESEGLFSAAICQSGSFLSPWAYQRWPKRAAFKLASLLNNTAVSNISSEDLLSFFQRLDAEDISKAAELYNKYIFNGTSEDIPSLEGANWAPTLEIESKNSFITEKMYGLLEAGKLVRVPLLIGFTTEENLNFHQDKEETERTMKMYDDDLTKLVPADLEIEDISRREKIGRLIRNWYTGGAPFAKNLGMGVKLSSDNDMTRPIMKQAELFSKYSKTYFYVFSFDDPSGIYNVYYDGAGTVGHGEELLYLFCLDVYCDLYKHSTSAQIARERLIKIWGNFAKFGNPTPTVSELLQNVSWPLLSANEDTFPYVEIGENITIKNFPNKEFYLKWNELYNSLKRNDFDTY